MIARARAIGAVIAMQRTAACAALVLVATAANGQAPNAPVTASPPASLEGNGLSESVVATVNDEIISTYDINPANAASDRHLRHPAQRTESAGHPARGDPFADR